MLNYKHLQYFHAVAMQGTVAKAAQQLHVSPQAISMQLQLLEEQVGQELLQKQGRLLHLTEAGKTVLHYASRIFDLGNELEQAVRRGVLAGQETLRVGICDIIPKAMAFRLLQPARAAGMAMHLICREGRFEDLLLDLGAHKLDLVLADSPLPAGSAVRGHSRLLGASGLAVLGHPDLCRAWPGTFPARLRVAPFLLPGSNATVRSQLDAWFEAHDLRPIVMGEFDDGALLKSFARAGDGFIVAPQVLAAAVCAEYGLQPVGSIDSVVEQFYAVSVERAYDHPAVRRILDGAAQTFPSNA
ncbi:MAG: LysR family transcriptional regulator [Pseudoduganella sp.]|nr:LysR family transcriptional regulator [Pseudoduganella sp.]